MLFFLVADGGISLHQRESFDFHAAGFTVRYFDLFATLYGSLIGTFASYVVSSDVVEAKYGRTEHVRSATGVIK